MTSRAKPTLSNTVRSGSSLKSWNTVPMLRRRNGTFHGESFPMFFPATKIWPLVGSSSLRSNRINVDFPEPDGPTTNTNSPLAISTEQSSSALWESLYVFVTWSSLIIVSVHRELPMGGLMLSKGLRQGNDRRPLSAGSQHRLFDCLSLAHRT